MIILTIPGRPTPFVSPTYSKRGTYNKKTKIINDYRLLIKSQYTGPLLSNAAHVDYLYCFACPSSFSKKKKEKALKLQLFPITRPDLDNLDKLVSDSLTGSVFTDDSIIIRKSSRKIYSNKEYTQIMIIPTKEDDDV